MSRRMKMGRARSRKIFTRAAKRIHPKNAINPMRGGIRI